MSGYNTKQRRALLAFLGEHPDELLTARQMADALAEKQISLSAVYRNLAQLEAEEKVRRSAKSGSHEAFYQYLDAKGCKGAAHELCEVRQNLSHGRQQRSPVCKALGAERAIHAGRSRHDPLWNLFGLQGKITNRREDRP